MTESMPRPSLQHRRMLAALLIGVVTIAAVGAGLASTLGVWDLGPGELFESLSSQTRGAWVWGNILLGVGVAVTTAGLAALADEVGGVLSRSGGALAVIAGTIAAIAFLQQGVGYSEAANLLNQSGDIPGGFLVIHAIQESLLTLFGGLAALGTIGISIGSFEVDWLTRGVGLSALALSLVALAPLILNIPFLALLGALAFGIALLSRAGRDSTEPHGREV